MCTTRHTERFDAHHNQISICTRRRISPRQASLRHAMELVTSSRVVCRSRPQVDALPHVCHLIAACLTPPKSWTVETAIRHGCDRLTRHLLNELAENPALHYLTKRSRARWYLSVAASVGDLALMEHLVARFGCCVDDSAIKAAVRGGHLEALQWLYTLALANMSPGEDAEAFAKNVLPDSNMGLASRIGNREMLQWMQSVTGRVFVLQILLEATRYGHLHVVERILPTATMPMTNAAKWHLTEAVTKSGSLDVAKFLLSKSMLLFTPDLMDGTVLHSRGQLELLQWMYDSGGEGCTSRAIDDATRRGYLNVVRWLHSKGVRPSPSAMDGAAWNGHLAVVRFLHGHCAEGCSLAAFTSAVNNDHLDVAKYLFEHRHEVFTNISINKVAGKGGLETIKWLQTKGLRVECTVDAMNIAAANGHLNVVSWLHSYRSEGCTASAMDQAAEDGHLEVVRFLHENRSEGCTPNAMNGAAGNGHIDVVKWLHYNRTEGCTADAMLHAARAGQLEIVKFLHSHRTEGCTTAAMDCACDLEILQWLGENRREGFTQRALLNAIEGGDLEMLLWLYKRSPAEMWTPLLAKRMVAHAQIEMLEWLFDASPDLVDARVLQFSHTPELWWVCNWLKRRFAS